MISLLFALAAMNCSGPFVPPSGFDKDNKIVLFDMEVVTGTEDFSVLTEKATQQMISRRCAAGDCTIQPRLWNQN